MGFKAKWDNLPDFSKFSEFSKFFRIFKIFRFFKIFQIFQNSFYFFLNDFLYFNLLLFLGFGGIKKINILEKSVVYLKFRDVSVLVGRFYMSKIFPSLKKKKWKPFFYSSPPYMGNVSRGVLASWEHGNTYGLSDRGAGSVTLWVCFWGVKKSGSKTSR